MHVPLRIHTPFSIGFGMIHPDQIIAHCKAHGLPAAGITDINSLSGALTVSSALRAEGIQPLVGTTLEVSYRAQSGNLVLFARTEKGWATLLDIVNTKNLSMSNDPFPLAELRERIRGTEHGLIALTGGRDGILAAALSSNSDPEALLCGLSEIFPDALYIEIQRGPDGPDTQEAWVRDMAHRLSLPLVATQSAHYPDPKSLEAHDAFLCIADKTHLDSDNRRHARPGCHLSDPDSFQSLFRDLPEALENSLEIARKIRFCPEPDRPRLPAFPDAGEDGEDTLLESQARNGLEHRLSHRDIDTEARKAYDARLAHELSIITRMGFSGYFLIVADFIGWARTQGIPVGPGRGSGAGSLVAYCLGITDIDPLEFGLIFERFLNPERVSMPDFDVDFCQERREEVIDYVRRKYGAERVAHIATFGTLQARAVVRDVGRVLQVRYPVVDRFAKMIPHNPSNPVTLSQALDRSDLKTALSESDDIIRTMFRIALQLEGLYRHSSTHAAGVIIADRPIQTAVPVHLDQNGKLTTSYEMKAVEQAGLVKFDFLGLKNLDIIEGTLAFLDAEGKQRPDFDRIAFKDPETFARLAAGDGFSVFQLESSGMREAMRQLEVETIEELVALISLYRPGPMEQIGTYAAVKRGERTVAYPHPEMKDVLDPTRGVMIYQEQVMEIARRIAGYSPGEADLLRRAMGKKKPAEMEAQRTRFLEGAASGWVTIHLDDGRALRLHADTRLPLADGSGQSAPLAQALEQNLDILV